ncbi:hypothetical protein TIFTF001_017079 [Ficus carica]|uniref:Uncharacterized protein n=1 Tax=Ficus carica TaxID=3494 RepID=A0AA88D9C1_FICCA|nr:hypothetical protein TIFTF001_017079 [Ficus carica]
MMQQYGDRLGALESIMQIEHKDKPKHTHPFTQEIMDVPLLERFKMPQISLYEGKTNPNDHIEISIGYRRTKILELFFYNFTSTTMNYYCDVNDIEGYSPPLETHSAISVHHSEELSFVISLKNSESPAPREDVAKEISANLYKISCDLYFLQIYFYCSLWVKRRKDNSELTNFHHQQLL